MFPLKNPEKYKKTYLFGVPTFYGTKHLGWDILTPIGIPLYSPSNGTVKYVKGSMDTAGGGGGHMAYFYPDGKPEVIRFLHLNVPPQEGKFLEGQQFGVTGATGTKVPHLHLDISKTKNIIIGNINTFIDPAIYQWTTMEPITIKVKLIANNCSWASWQTKIDQVKDWYQTNSSGRIILQFDVEHTEYSDIPFQDYDEQPAYWAWGVEKNWLIQNILPKSIGNDVVIFHMRTADWGDHPQTQGVMLGDLTEQKTSVINQRCNEDNTFGQWGSEFMYIACHELSHFILGLTAQDVVNGENITHKYFETANWLDAVKIFEVLNYQTLINVLAVRRKELDMSNAVFIHKKGTPEYGFILPATSVDAVKDKALNLGREDIIKPDGSIDFSKAKEVEY